MNMAEQSARQALALDPKIGEAHAVLAQINSDKGNLLDAESGFFFAISLEPNEPTPHHWYSILLSKVGRLDAALEQARRAYELDPTAPVLASNLGNAYLLRGDHEQASRYSRLARELGIGGGSNDGVEATIAMRTRRLGRRRSDCCRARRRCRRNSARWSVPMSTPWRILRNVHPSLPSCVPSIPRWRRS
jgi:Flp pilus assembly protein TadD